MISPGFHLMKPTTPWSASPRSTEECWSFEPLIRLISTLHFQFVTGDQRNARHVITGVPNKTVVTGGTPRHVHSRSNAASLRVSEENAGFFPEKPATHRDLGSWCSVPRADASPGIDRMDQAELCIVDQLPLLPFLNSLDRQSHLLFELIEGTIVGLKRSMDADDGLHCGP